MIGMRSFTIPTEGKMLAVIASVLTLGTLAFALIALAAVVAVAYLIDLALGILVSLSMQVALLYSSSDPALKLFMLYIVGYLLIKLFLLVKRSLVGSFARS